MSSDSEIEGTPAEAAWAMLTVLIIIIVVLIFCCGVPFYQALEKRWHHWDDLGNDPRWDVENFQFSPTSPQLIREANPNYNRLSVCSTENGSSKGTSSSGINRGDGFKNSCVLPRFPDQVEFRLPPSYDDLVSKGTIDEDSSPPAYSITDPNDEEELIEQNNKEHIIVPVLTCQAMNTPKKPQTQTSPTISGVPVLQEKNKTPDKLALVQTNTNKVHKSDAKTETIPSAQSKTNMKNVKPNPAKASSQTSVPTKNISTATKVIQIKLSSSDSAVLPVKKTNMKIKKPVPEK